MPRAPASLVPEGGPRPANPYWGNTEPVVVTSPTFDSTSVTFDSTAFTMDSADG